MRRALAFSFILAAGCAHKPVDKEQVREVFRGHTGDVVACYNDFQRTHPARTIGKIVLRIATDEQGNVTDAHADSERTTLQDGNLEKCITDKAFTWKFPVLESGQKLDVSFPYMFTDGPLPQGTALHRGRDRGELAAAVTKRANDYTRCYETYLKVSPAPLQGQITLRLSIAPFGSVTNVAVVPSGTNFRDHQLEHCMFGVTRKLKFNKIDLPGNVEVDYPFHLHVGDGKS